VTSGTRRDSRQHPGTESNGTAAAAAVSGDTRRVNASMC